MMSMLTAIKLLSVCAIGLQLGCGYWMLKLVRHTTKSFIWYGFAACNFVLALVAGQYLNAPIGGSYQLVLSNQISQVTVSLMLFVILSMLVRQLEQKGESEVLRKYLLDTMADTYCELDGQGRLEVIPASCINVTGYRSDE
jgi:hypothetical protein